MGSELISSAAAYNCWCKLSRSMAMARLGRYFLPDQPLHVIQRGNNREAIFFAEDELRLLPRLACRSSR
jgi:hypothetical protein